MGEVAPGEYATIALGNEECSKMETSLEHDLMCMLEEEVQRKHTVMHMATASIAMPEPMGEKEEEEEGEKEEGVEEDGPLLGVEESFCTEELAPAAKTNGRTIVSATPWHLSSGSQVQVAKLLDMGPL